jgi:ATP-dependent Clp protease ATP-binding subunit ClpC
MNWLKSFWKRLATPVVQEYQQASDQLADFTPRAQKVVELAREEASRLHNNCIGTEHLLLALIRLGQGTAVTVLGKMGVDLEAARREVEKVGVEPNQKVFGATPFTPQVKQVLAIAAEEAKALNHTYVGTEHILLALLRERDNVAGRVLESMGVNKEVARQHVLSELDPTRR